MSWHQRLQCIRSSPPSFSSKASHTGSLDFSGSSRRICCLFTLWMLSFQKPPPPHGLNPQLRQTSLGSSTLSPPDSTQELSLCSFTPGIGSECNPCSFQNGSPAHGSCFL